MNFSYGVIIAVGVLAAISLALIAISPDEIMAPKTERMDSDTDPKMPTVSKEMYEEPAIPDPVTITIPKGSAVPGCEQTDECYLPYVADTTTGVTVSWFNEDSAAHTVTSGSFDQDNLGDVFDSGLLAPGKTFEFVFDEAGSYDYLCIVHPWMLGVVDVS